MPMRTLIRTALATAAACGIVFLGASPAAAAPSDQDTTWVKAAHQSNLAEIAAGQAAQQSATNDDVKNLGAMFVQMHTQLDDSLKAAAQQLDVDLPDGPTAQQEAQLAAVKEKSGQAFDTAWIAQQIGSHSTTLAATQKELQAGSDDQVLQLARTATPVVQQHLDELRDAAQKYGVPASVPGGTGGQAAGGELSAAGWGAAGAGALAITAGAALLVRRRSSLR
jgi:putative membrane protein